ncbi:Hypothetical predicted protein [Pelobates cultripes]|uniref:Uncharacterized protein n=1 Tax=Pelobates cultripes TaxID=61616 RepID=A0AAD1W1W3_PELCU|nr:Hypothetical predicted protein [Pelobates cultripes]
MSTKGLQAKSHPNQQLPVTPAIVKRKQVQQRNTFRSPTDSLVSPCSRVLRKAKFEASSRLVSSKAIKKQMGKGQCPGVMAKRMNSPEDQTLISSYCICI